MFCNNIKVNSVLNMYRLCNGDWSYTKQNMSEYKENRKSHNQSWSC